MQTALRSLGKLDANERIRRFFLDQAYACEPMEHDVDCGCPHCERRRVLELRKDRRRVPVEAINRLSGYAQPEGTKEGINRKGKTFRHRPMDENARRGESKLGRAAKMKPGRITLGVMRTGLGEANANVHGNTGEKPGPRRVEEDPQTREADCLNAVSSQGQTSWDSAAHSVQSNLAHRKAKRVVHEARPELKEGDLPEPVPLVDEFYKRNPAALANGWLAMSHHRDVPTWTCRETEQDALDKVARELVRPDRPVLVGLMPPLKLNTKQRRGHRAI